MWRRLSPLLLMLALLLGQAGAAVHALSHLHPHREDHPAAGVKADTHDGECAWAADEAPCNADSGDSDVCTRCLAFDAAAVAIPSLAGWPAAACLRNWHYPHLAERHLSPVYSPRPRSRGPPLTNGTST